MLHEEVALEKVLETWIEFSCGKIREKDLQIEIQLFTRVHKQENVRKIKRLIWLEPIVNERVWQNIIRERWL